MSEILRLPSSKVSTWLEKETGSVLVPVHKKAQKLLDEMKRLLETVRDNSKMLLDSSEKEIEKRNKKTYGRARALNRLARLFLKRIQQIAVPEQVSYSSFSNFFQEINKAFLVIEVDIKNWFPRISPFFIFDRRKFLRVFEKAKESLKEIQSFIEDEYVKTKTLEYTFQLSGDLLALEAKIESLEAEKRGFEARKSSIEDEMRKTQQKMEEFRNKETLTEISEVDAEIKNLTKRLKRDLRHLRKPFIKFQRIVFNKGGLSPDESGKLDNYIKNPFIAFATEESGYPHLKKILRTMDLSISSGKLKLKHSRELKARQDVDSMINKGSLDGLHKKCREVLMRKKKLSTSAEITKAKRKIHDLQQNLKTLKKTMKRVELEEKIMNQNWKEVLERLHDQKSEIEKNVFDFIGKKILIEPKVH